MTKTTILAVAIAALAGSAHAQEAQPNGINIGGTVRVNYGIKFYDDESKDKGGDFDFDIAAIKFNGKLDDFGLSAEYRFTSDTDYIKTGYGYYDINDDIQIQLGITQVPFGNRGFISNSFWFGLPYYLGFEDDSDVGIKALFTNGNWNTDLGFFKNPEYGPEENKRYATDLYTGTINGTDYYNEETNQLNLRQTYTMQYGGGSTTLGGSLMWGQIYNSETDDNGDRYAIAAHVDSSFNGWNVQLQALQYEFDAENQAGVDNNKIGVSVVSWQYEVAAKGQVYSFNLAKTFPTSWGSIKVYNDFGYMTPDVDDSSFDNSAQNVTGAAFSAGPVYIMADLILGKNMTFSTEKDDHIGLAEAGDGWDERININFGYYF
ncbi:hypothetical protein [Ferrimonas lipolytica]|uniref:Phosphate-selective porin O and P n=1 Tax=Ferrimonas lipolytica TaxID=2724191 RepID=A0A6H1UK74_9GAMM|nr:hypothetical protein [Ferrimonas lipolytica]QIZ78626.1 hypothetical protein HER31_17975 [Ferrimonas lipolytica]